MFNIYMAYYTQHGTECYKKKHTKHSSTSYIFINVTIHSETT